MRVPAILALLVLFSCKKEDGPSATPEIELISISPTLVESFGEPVVVRLSYKDGNGDLGEEDPDVRPLEVKDSRLNAADTYHVPPLAPVGSDVSIEGELNVELDPLFLIGNGAQEQVTYTIRLRDREGNWSNAIVTSPVLVVDSL